MVKRLIIPTGALLEPGSGLASPEVREWARSGRSGKAARVVAERLLPRGWSATNRQRVIEAIPGGSRGSSG